MSTREDFVARFGGVFEHSPWIAEAAYDGGLPDALTVDGVHGLLCAVLRTASQAAKLALIVAHPDLAGKLSRAGALTTASSAEQTSAGLDRLSDEDFQRFTTLNAAYTKRFAMPFVMAVKGCHTDVILAAFETRLLNDRQTEFATALSEIEKIALLRIQEIMTP